MRRVRQNWGHGPAGAHERARQAEAHARRIQTDGAFQVAADAWEEAGDHVRARLMVAIQPSVVAERQRAYREDELRRLRSEIRQIEEGWRTAPRQERATALDGAVQYLERDPEILEERVRWLLDGTFGAGAMFRAYEIAREIKRQNRAAQLFQLVMLLDDSLPSVATAAVWRRLSPAAQRNVTRMMNEALREAETTSPSGPGLGT